MSDVMTIPAGVRHPGRWVNLLTVVQAVGAVALLVVVQGPALHRAPTTRSLLAATAFLLAELFVFHVEFRREAMTFSLAEVPLAFGLIFLMPSTVLIARLMGTIAAMLISGRPSLSKLLFNAANLALDTTLAVLIFRTIAMQSGEPSGLLMVLALLPALTLASFLSGLSVSVALSCFEGGLWQNVRTEIVEGPRTATMVACLAAMSVSPALIDLRLTPLSIAPIVAFWFVARSGGQAAQSTRDLEEMHSFSRQIGRSLELSAIAATAATEIERLIRAARCRLVIFDPAGGHERLRHGDPTLDSVLPDTAAAWAYQLQLGKPVRVSAGDGSPLGAQLIGAGLHELVVVSVADDDGLLGALTVADRNGVADHFDEAEVRRLSALADQLGGTLRRAFLHEELERESSRDSLTGRPNRSMLERQAAAALREASTSEVVGILTIDLERFSEVNETLGHAAGDALLCQACDRLELQLRPEDLLARIGGNELAVLAVRNDAHELVALAGSLGNVLTRAYRIEGLDIAVDGKVGGAFWPAHGEDVTTLLRRADIARREAGRNHARWEFYRPGIDQATVERLALITELRQATDSGGLELYFQPKQSVESGHIVGAEALVRWNHPTRGVVRPDDFIPLAERTGLILPLTGVVLEQALVELQRWHEQGWMLSVAVNVSIQNLLDELLPDRIARLLARHRIEPHFLVLEITESSVMADTTRTMRTLERLDELGIGLSIDDFGTGYSSLSYLRSLPVRELKIDKSFISDILSEEHDDVIVHSTIELAHNLGLRVVAEGVENDAIAERLARLGCDIVQGYGVAPPLTSDDFAAFMRARLDVTKRDGSTEQPAALG